MAKPQILRVMVVLVSFLMRFYATSVVRFFRFDHRSSVDFLSPRNRNMLIMRPMRGLAARLAQDTARHTSEMGVWAGGAAAKGCSRAPILMTRPQQIQQTRTILSMVRRSKTKQLKALEQDANRYPDDAYKQLRFLQELNKSYPALVIRRIEENRFAMDEEIQKEYVKALVKYVVSACSH